MVVDLGQLADEVRVAVDVGQRHRIAIGAVQPFDAVGFGLGVGGGDAGVIEEHEVSAGLQRPAYQKPILGNKAHLPDGYPARPCSAAGRS